MTYDDNIKSYIPRLSEIYVETYNAPPWNDKWTISLSTQRLDEMINCHDSYGLVCISDDGELIGMIVGNSKTYYDCTQSFIKDFL